MENLYSERSMVRALAQRNSILPLRRMHAVMFDDVEQILMNASSEEMNYLYSYVLAQLIDDTIRGQCLEFHRAIKLGFFFLDESKDDEKKHEIVDGIGLDVFGQIPKSKQFECVCPHCQRSLAAARFAPHLASCMGIGRTSSRLAHKRLIRITNTNKVESDNDDYDNDSDWNYNSDRKPARKKRDRNSHRRINRGRGRNGDASAYSELNYEVMSMEQKKAIFDQVCGVVSEHTKKICTKSLRCPQHSEVQKKYIRDFVLGRTYIVDANEDIQIDVDTIDNGIPSVPSKKKERKTPCSSRSSYAFQKKSKSKFSHNVSDSSSFHYDSDLV